MPEIVRRERRHAGRRARPRDRGAEPVATEPGERLAVRVVVGAAAGLIVGCLLGLIVGFGVGMLVDSYDATVLIFGLLLVAGPILGVIIAAR